MTDTEKLRHISKGVADFYNRLHRVINFSGNSVQSYRTDDLTFTYNDIIRDSGIKERMKILDCGFGLGDFDFYLASKVNCDITAVSFSEFEVATARELYHDKKVKGKLNFELADFHFLNESYSPDSFDMVMFLESFEHVFDKAKVLKDAYQLLKPGGFFFTKFHFLLWRNAIGREDVFRENLVHEAENLRNFSHLPIHDFVKLADQIGYQVELIKLPSFANDNYAASYGNIEDANKAIPDFNYKAPDFAMTQCYNTLLRKVI